MSAVPSPSPWFTAGAEITAPSRTMAGWFCGGAFRDALAVRAENCRAPAESRRSRTSRPLVCRPSTALAEVT
ncbi:hypothetical protein OG485_10690 [Streptomyces sp. NBC_00328]|nr:hypothetical protein [Streptomyces sp. NBC_00328]